MKPEHIEPAWVAKAMELADAYALECALHQDSAADEERAALLAHLLSFAHGVATPQTPKEN